MRIGEVTTGNGKKQIPCGNDNKETPAKTKYGDSGCARMTAD